MIGTVINKIESQVSFVHNLPDASPILSYWLGLTKNVDYINITKTEIANKLAATGITGSDTVYGNQDGAFLGYHENLIKSTYSKIPGLPYNYESLAQKLINDNMLPLDFNKNTSLCIVSWKHRWFRFLLPGVAAIQLLLKISSDEYCWVLGVMDYTKNFIWYTERSESFMELTSYGYDIQYALF